MAIGQYIPEYQGVADAMNKTHEENLNSGDLSLSNLFSRAGGRTVQGLMETQQKARTQADTTHEANLANLFLDEAKTKNAQNFQSSESAKARDFTISDEALAAQERLKEFEFKMQQKYGPSWLETLLGAVGQGVSYGLTRKIGGN